MPDGGKTSEPVFPNWDERPQQHPGGPAAKQDEFRPPDPREGLADVQIARATGRQGHVNTLVLGHDLRFRIRYYERWEAWDAQRIQRHRDDGELMTRGLVKGDRHDIRPLHRGFVYVFGEPSYGNFTLDYVFEVEGQSYQRVAAKGQTIDYEKKVGDAQPYAVIPRYFHEQPNKLPKRIHIVASPIKLSQERLFTHPKHALINSPLRRGQSLSLTRRDLGKIETNPMSGPEIRERFLEPWKFKEKASVTLTGYNFIRRNLGGDDGLDVCIPDPLEEAKRRAYVLQQRMRTYLRWHDDPDRNEKSFIIQTVKAIINHPDRRHYRKKIDDKKLSTWEREATKQHIAHYFPVHWATEHLLAILEHEPIFWEWMRDFNFGDDDQQYVAHDAMAYYVKDLHHTKQGREYLGKYIDDKQGYHCESVDVACVGDGAAKNFKRIRSLKKGFFKYLDNIVPVLWAKQGPRFRVFVDSLLKNRPVERIAVRAIKVGIEKREGGKKVTPDIEQYDTYELNQRVKAMGSKAKAWMNGLVSFLDTVNVCIAVYTLTHSKNADEAVHNSLSLVSALSSFGLGGAIGQGVSRRVGNRIAKSGAAQRAVQRQFGERLSKHGAEAAAKAQRRLAGQVGKYAAKRALAVVSAIGGLIDTYLSFRKAYQEFGSGDTNSGFAWIGVGLGCAITAAGGLITAFGLKATAAGSATGPLGLSIGAIVTLIGVLVSVIGLIAVWLADDDEIDEWLIGSFVGRGSSAKHGSNQATIKALNELMTKFEAECSFKETDMRFRVSTRVTLTLEPRHMPDDTVIRVTNVKYKFWDRWGELLSSSIHNKTGAGRAFDQEFRLTDRAVKVTRDDEGNVKEVEVSLHIDNDVDELEVDVALDFNDGEFLGYERAFVFTP